MNEPKTILPPEPPPWAVSDEVDRALESCTAEWCVGVNRTSEGVTVTVGLLEDTPPHWWDKMTARFNAGPAILPHARWLVCIDSTAGDKLTVFSVVPKSALS